MWNPGLIQVTKTKRDMGIGKAVLSAVIAFGLISILALATRAEDIAVIYTDEYLMNQRKTEVGIAPGEEDHIVDVAEMVSNPYLTIPISDEEFDELRWVIALEAQGEVSKVGLKSEIACCEAIFNRVLSKRWPDTVHDVLKQRGQFPATYKVMRTRKAWATPCELEDDAISECLRRGPSVLPSMKYVFFDSKGGVNGSKHITIGGHTFGAEH